MVESGGAKVSVRLRSSWEEIILKLVGCPDLTRLMLVQGLAAR